MKGSFQRGIHVGEILVLMPPPLLTPWVWNSFSNLQNHISSSAYGSKDIAYPVDGDTKKDSGSY